MNALLKNIQIVLPTISGCRSRSSAAMQPSVGLYCTTVLDYYFNMTKLFWQVLALLNFLDVILLRYLVLLRGG